MPGSSPSSSAASSSRGRFFESVGAASGVAGSSPAYSVRGDSAVPVRVQEYATESS